MGVAGEEGFSVDAVCARGGLCVVAGVSRCLRFDVERCRRRRALAWAWAGAERVWDGAGLQSLQRVLVMSAGAAEKEGVCFAALRVRSAALRLTAA